MLKITLKNGKEYTALDSTAVYPSDNPNIRSRMEIHLPEYTMPVDTFAAIFADEDATSEIRMTRTVDEDNPEKTRRLETSFMTRFTSSIVSLRVLGRNGSRIPIFPVDKYLKPCIWW